jgi:deazaflavin-dependent oxidoreductase (nitroreductase family)
MPNHKLTGTTRQNHPTAPTPSATPQPPANAQPAPAAPAQPVAIGPSRFVRAVFGPLTTVLNPVIVKLAGRRHVRFAAQISHTGRRSGRQYVTPASARLAGDTFVIPLTFGNQSDWSRNVRAAGGCSIRLNGVDYRAVRPRLADAPQARQAAGSAFSPVERATFRILGIRQFLLLDLAEG